MKNLTDRPFALIGVHMNMDGEDPPRVKEIMGKNQLPWRTFVDKGEIVDQWKPSGTPAFFVIDARGVIRHKWAGPPGPKVLDRALDEAIREAVATKKP